MAPIMLEKLAKHLTIVLLPFRKHMFDLLQVVLEFGDVAGVVVLRDLLVSILG